MEKSLIDILWILICSGLVFLMQPGFLCLESGLTRSKNAINVAIKNIADFGISVSIFWIIGYSLMFGLSQGGWLGQIGFGVTFTDVSGWMATFFIFQAMFCATATTIVSGAIAERVSFRAYLMMAIVISGLIYPVFGHWAWGGHISGAQGWLEAKGFVDFAGSSVVHSVGGWVALAALLIVGPRTGMFEDKNKSKSIQGANIPMAMLGTLLLFLGWFGFNGGSTFKMNASVPGIIVNTSMAGVSGLVATLILSRMVKGYFNVNLIMFGVLAGLVSITASCHAVSTVDALIIGAIGGAVMLLTELLLEKFKIDDAVGAVPVHLGAGLWGTLAVAIFGNREVLGTGLAIQEQLQVQLAGMGICAVYSFGVAFIFLYIINLFFKLRVSQESEHVGLNYTEHRAKTEFTDLLMAMEYQGRTKDFSYKVPVEPFTEIGQIADRYNSVMTELQQFSSLADSVIDASKEGILTVASDGLIIKSFNPSASEMLEYSQEEAKGKPLWEILKSSQFNFSDEETLKNLSVKNSEKGIIQTKSSKEIMAQIVVSVLPSNNVLNYSINIADITERERYEAELRRKTRDLEERTAELETINRSMIGRELKMVDLKKEIKKLKEKVDSLQSN